MALVCKSIQNIQHTVSVPDLVILCQHLTDLLNFIRNGLSCLQCCLAGLEAPIPEVGECLVLINKLVNNIPQPLVGQIKRHWLFRI